MATNIDAEMIESMIEDLEDRHNPNDDIVGPMTYYDAQLLAIIEKLNTVVKSQKEEIDGLIERVDRLENADKPNDMYAEHQRMKRLMPDW